MGKVFNYLLIALLIPAIPQQSHARDYFIELIIFEHADTDAQTDEHWDFSAGGIADNLQRMQSLAAKSTPYEIQSSLNVLDSAQKELISSGYRILRTANWIQPSAFYYQAPLIPLSIDGTESLYGFIRIYKTSLIFADVDLQFSPDNISAILSAELITNKESSLGGPFPKAHYFLSEKRRLKFKEIHYFDHPKIGVILGIWPA